MDKDWKTSGDFHQTSAGSMLLQHSSPGITLDEPDYHQMRQDRLDRTRATMKAVDPHVASKVVGKGDRLSTEDQAAVCIQANFRGYLGRKLYLQELWLQFEKEEEMRLEKTQKQVEEGQLLVENHRLEVEFDDNTTTRRNKSRQYISHVITIQRAWRMFRRRQNAAADNNNTMSPQLSESEELSETESTNGTQAMSLATPEDSEKNLYPEDEIQSDSDSIHNIEFDSTPSPDHAPAPPQIEPEPDSVVSDYSEMADPLKEHLANVQIIQKEDLEIGNTMFANQFSIGQKVQRTPDETEEEFNKRLRKINYLSLAQEFAELKKVDADALPFNLHKGPQDFTDISPMSEVSSETESDRYLTDSSANTPMDSTKDFGGEDEPSTPTTDDGKVDNDEDIEGVIGKFQSSLRPMEAWLEATSGVNFENQEVVDNVLNQNEELSSSDAQKQNVTNLSTFAPRSTHTDRKMSKTELITDRETIENVTKAMPKDQNAVTTDNAGVPTQNQINMSASEEPDFESQDMSPPTKMEASSPQKKSSVSSPGSEKLEDFDVYNIESTLPHMDWALLEEHLQKAAEEEKRKRESGPLRANPVFKEPSRRNDREEIRRKLAMGGDEEYYGGERMYKKPNLSTRLQGGMNLQICFMNEVTSDQESINGDCDDPRQQSPRVKHFPEVCAAPGPALPADQTNQVPKQIQPEQKEPPEGSPTSKKKREEEEEDLDFFERQARLQNEAKLALAQVRPMAHMQLEVERQMRKKSPIAEMVGISGFGVKKKLGKRFLHEMNVAQLQVVVNDLHTQIESLNEELVMLLVQRDDLHMEQDSMLVDIEDLSRRAQESAAEIDCSVKLNKPPKVRPPKNK